MDTIEKLDALTGTLIESVKRTRTGWTIVLDDGTTLTHKGDVALPDAIDPEHGWRIGEPGQGGHHFHLHFGRALGEHAHAVYVPEDELTVK